MATTYWARLRGHGAAVALEAMRLEYGEMRTPSHIMALGVAFMWLKMYQQAFDHFDEVIRSAPRGPVANPRRSAGVFGMAGAAKWCLGNRGAAVDQWRAGLTADYADGAGGVQLPMLLYTASVAAAPAFPKAEAVSILQVKSRDSRITNWPGPLGRFLLGQIDQTELNGILTGMNDIDTGLREWQARFYLGVARMERGDIRGFREAMRESVQTATDESKPEGFFTRCLWHEEFFIARHELSEN